MSKERCGAWMPVAKQHCGRPDGHNAKHASIEAMQRQNADGKARTAKRSKEGGTCGRKGCHEPCRQFSTGTYSLWCIEHSRERELKQQARYANDPEFRERQLECHRPGHPYYQKALLSNRQSRRRHAIKRDRELIADLERSLNVTA